MKLIPYLYFDGNCREVLAFYQQCLGGELEVMTLGDMPGQESPGQPDWIIHAQLTSGGLVLRASDGMPGQEPHVRGNNVQLNIECATAEEVDALYAKLAEGGNAMYPPHDAFFGSRFGMLVDRFGVEWMLVSEAPAHV